MSLRQNSGLRRLQKLNNPLYPHGEDGAAVRIPADIRRDLELETGEDGDQIDLEYDRNAATLTVHFDRESLDVDELDERGAILVDPEALDDQELEELDAILSK